MGDDLISRRGESEAYDQKSPRPFQTDIERRWTTQIRFKYDHPIGRIICGSQFSIEERKLLDA